MTHTQLTRSQKKDLQEDLGMSAMASVVTILILTLFMVFVPKLWTEFQRRSEVTYVRDIERDERSNDFWKRLAGQLPEDASTPQGRLARDIRAHKIESTTKDTLDKDGNQLVEFVSVPQDYYRGLTDATTLCPFINVSCNDGGAKFTDDFVKKIHIAEAGHTDTLLRPIAERKPIEESAGMLWFDPFLNAWLMGGSLAFLISIAIAKRDDYPDIPTREYFWPRLTDLPYHRAGSAVVALPVFAVVEITRGGLYIVKKRQVKLESRRVARELESQRLKELEKEQASPLFDKLTRARELRRQLDALPQTEEVVRQQEYASQLIGFLTEDPKLYTEHHVNETAEQIGARLRELASSADAVVETQKELGLR